MKKVTTYVLKVASRCNLNCSYCYMYNLGDETYLGQPKSMTISTIVALSKQLDIYCESANINSVHIVFHGGEPLLLNREYFIKCIDIFKSNSPKIEFTFSIQTNGVKLDQSWYDLFVKEGVRVGVSFDGPRKYHDEFRVFHNGRGSYDQVTEVIRLGKGNGLVGILSVINLGIPSQEYYQEMKDLKIESLDLLLPDGHFNRLPDGFEVERFGEYSYTPYADWLIEIFRLWKIDRSRPSIRLFQNIIKMIMGEENVGNQAFGRRTNGVVVIETNGGVEVVDSLRACYEGITRNDLNVQKNKIEELFADDVFEVYYNSHDMVCEQCLNCPVYDLCGGGFLGNRYSNDTGFDNPSIYCKDIVRLVSFIQNDIVDSLPTKAVNKVGAEKLAYDEIIREWELPSLVKIDKTVKEKLRSFKINDTVCA